MPKSVHYFFFIFIKNFKICGALWCSGKASDSRFKVSGFDPREHHVVSLSKTLYPHCLVLTSTKVSLHIILKKEGVAVYMYVGI